MAKQEKQTQPQQSAAPQQITTEQLTAFINQQVNTAGAEMMKRLNDELRSKTTLLDKLAPAYIAAVKECRNVVKNATNPHLKNTYADLTVVLDVVKEGFLNNDLWVMQFPGEITVKDGNPYMAVHGVLLHSSGQSVGLKMELPAFAYRKDGRQEVSAQTAGSAITYARRYMLAALAGITQVDDDADAVSYIDTAGGPSAAVNSAAPAQSTPTSSFDDLKKQLRAAKTMEALLELRKAAQDTKDKGVMGIYLDQRTALKEVAA